MSEKSMRNFVITALRKLDAVSVENKAYPGTPDVNYKEGWLELKWLRSWPKNCDKRPLVIKHFKKEQRVWLKRRWNAGGNVFLLLQINRNDWLLFDGKTAANIVGTANRPELFKAALRTWKNLEKKELLECLSGNLRN